MRQQQASVALILVARVEAVAARVARRRRRRVGPADRGSAPAADGRVRLLVVLDLDPEALAAEAKSHEARREVGPAVEVIDRPAWPAMRGDWLQAA